MSVKIRKYLFQLFTRNTTRASSAPPKPGEDAKEMKPDSVSSNSNSDSDDNKKCVYKLSSTFYKRFGTEEICELCNGKYPSPVTYHMRSAHRGCGKSGILKGYTANGKYKAKLKGSCGEGGKKGAPCYVICDSCRERYLQIKKLKTVFQGFSPLGGDSPSRKCSHFLRVVGLIMLSL